MPTMAYIDADTGEPIATHAYRATPLQASGIHVPVPPIEFRCCRCHVAFRASPPTECPACGHIYVMPTRTES